MLFLSFSCLLLLCHGAGFLVVGRTDGPNVEPQERLYTPPSLRTSSAHQASLVPVFPGKPGNRPSGFVAFGDSYSAGIGTGVKGKEDDCRHGLHAHPVLILQDMAFGFDDPESNLSVQLLSCTGSTVDDLLVGSSRSQIDSFNTTAISDFALLSIGGNDLGFFEVMNACVFRFYSFYSGTCEEALLHANAAISSPDFEHRLLIAIMEILDKVHWEKRHWFTITVTGYARFFNADTVQCDDYSFGVWWQGPRLTRKVRQRMNELVEAVNAKIRHSVAFVNSHFLGQRVLFVDYDARFDGHRFCEPNVTEPDYARNETWFFLVGGNDNFRNSTDQPPPPLPAPPPPIDDPPSFASPAPRRPIVAATSSPLLSALSSLVDPSLCLRPAQASGDWGELALCYMTMAKHRDPSLRFSNPSFQAQDSMWYIPTYYGKTFHPRSLGHQAIRDEIYALWQDMGDYRRSASSGS